MLKKNERTDWTLESLFGRSLPRLSCNVALSSVVKVALPSDEASSFTLAPEMSVFSEDGVAVYDITNGECLSFLIDDSFTHDFVA